MFELIFCSLLTILPDYLYRRYVQGKRFGREINLFTVWYELRWGITSCAILTISLITVVFYFHPATNNVTSFYRTVPVLPETGGRVTEIYVGLSEDVKAGQPVFRLDSSVQEAQVESARKRIEEIDAQIALAQTDLITADGRIQEAVGAYEQALNELETKAELRGRNPDVVSTREIERLQNLVSGRLGAVDSAKASKVSIQTNIDTVLPASRASAVADLAEAQVALDKTVIYAGVDGRMEQFTLRVGDYVNPMLRPAGILIPTRSGELTFEAGFGQIAAPVLKVGMAAELACASRPFEVIPMVVSQIQTAISSGQLRQTDILVDPNQIVEPGSVTVYLEPMFAGGTEGIPPGSTCMANAYTNNHDLLQDESLSSLHRLTLHGIDAVGLVHALLLRLQVIILPVSTLVLSGGH
jgi:multidrug resistance efflux pump